MVVVEVVGPDVIVVVVVVELEPVVLVVEVEVVLVVLLVDVVLVEDVLDTPSGAHSTLGALGVTVREPNWSLTMTGASVAFGHFSL